MSPFFFFFNDTATTEIYTLSLHDALPICGENSPGCGEFPGHGDSRPGIDRDRSFSISRRADARTDRESRHRRSRDRKSTRLNSSHSQISYAVFCLKKKKNSQTRMTCRQCD